MLLRRSIPLWLVAPILLPLLLVAARLLTPTPEVWLHLWETRLLEMFVGTTLLVGGVGATTLLLGTGLAWLVSVYTFPGRNLFVWLLLLPLAVPTYVLGFVMMATFDFAGPVQTALRGWFGPEAWFPEIRSLGGAVLVMMLALYPYVYLLARAAFREQALSTLEAARTMGYSHWQALLKVALPLARPSLVAGTTLAMLEALTDFATVRFFNVPTFSEGVFRIWEGMMDREAATELAALLLMIALAIILLERALRGQARYTQTGGPVQRLAPQPLRGRRAWGATAVCGLTLAVAFVLPVGQLLAWAVAEWQNPIAPTADGVAWRYVLTTLGLAAAAALLAVGMALLVASSARLNAGWLGRAATGLAGLGYAMPGAVVAAGTLLVLAATDNLLNSSGLISGLLLTGSIVGLLYAYLVRFLAVALNSVDASLEKVTPRLVEAARCMGASRTRILGRVHAPLVQAGLLAGAILVFVDVMKELPVTILLRPFGMDTLAIWTYMLAAESYWQAAAIPALVIVLAGLLPVALLVRAGDSGGRP
ncbi:MAG: iron ABC transporter permease [Chloroflexaceae bacterium]|jgi:iron(III) transport system permease protein|nr:iron ABC transporter permease [Chloroflexaceae bacterium]